MNEMTLTFTVGELIGFLFLLIGFIAAIAFVFFLIHLVKLVKEARILVKEIHLTVDDAREKVDNIFGVMGTVGETFGKVKTALNFAEKIKEKKRKKNKRQGED